MKMLFFSTLLIFEFHGLAQGTIEFEVHPRGPSALPPTGATYQDFGVFHLDNANFLTGQLVLEGDWRHFEVTSARIYETPFPEVLGDRRFDFKFEITSLGFPPFDPGADLYTLKVQISPENRLSLLAGNWYVNVETGLHPTGETRGQIVVVPEPSTLALFGLGSALLVGRCRRLTH